MNRYKDEMLYIAGPACFYPRGYDLWEALRKKATYLGFGVALPNDNKLELNHADLRLNADVIFANCAESMNHTTTIVADLEQFRGSEPDGGTVYEIGMAYARGLRCYGYTRDKRDMVHKHQQTALRGGVACDLGDRPLPYGDLPFCPSLVGACKLVEGSFDDCMKTLMTDLDEEAKQRARGDKPATPAPEPKRIGAPRVFLSGIERYEPDAVARYAEMKVVCKRYGLEAVTPLDGEQLICDDPYTRAAADLDRWQKSLAGCDMLLANLNDFHGYEPASDVAFECGSAWQQGKRCYGYMEDTSVMRQRIPHHGDDRDNADICGNAVENFDYPINLMFASSMPVFSGSFEQVVERAASHFFNSKAD